MRSISAACERLCVGQVMRKPASSADVTRRWTASVGLRETRNPRMESGRAIGADKPSGLLLSTSATQVCTQVLPRKHGDKVVGGCGRRLCGEWESERQSDRVGFVREGLLALCVNHKTHVYTE